MKQHTHPRPGGDARRLQVSSIYRQIRQGEALPLGEDLIEQGFQPADFRLPSVIGGVLGQIVGGFDQQQLTQPLLAEAVQPAAQGGGRGGNGRVVVTDESQNPDGGRLVELQPGQRLLRQLEADCGVAAEVAYPLFVLGVGGCLLYTSYLMEGDDGT